MTDTSQDIFIRYLGGPLDGEYSAVHSLAPIDAEGGTYTYQEAEGNNPVFFVFRKAGESS